MDGVGRVVVGVDGSVGSLQALRRAVTEARMRAVPLVAVIAWTAPGGEAAYRRTFDVQLKQLWEQGAWERLARAWDEALGGIPEDVDVRQVAVRADAGKALVCVANDENDLMVIGAGRRSVWRRAFIPSVPRYCAAHARCAMLVVPPSPLSQQMDHGMLPRLLRRKRAVNGFVGH
jgi:nucleotide-binding universal stress UspA family protein